MKLEVLIDDSRVTGDNRGELCNSSSCHDYQSVNPQVSMTMIADSQSSERKREEKE
jgi:hypothetical protein